MSERICRVDGTQCDPYCNGGQCMTDAEAREYEAAGRSPIYENDGLWYFWDETWAYFYGPFHSLEEAERELKRYVESL